MDKVICVVRRVDETHWRCMMGVKVLIGLVERVMAGIRKRSRGPG